jgi:methyl-accepting chemotaxis protein
MAGHTNRESISDFAVNQLAAPQSVWLEHLANLRETVSATIRATADASIQSAGDLRRMIFLVVLVAVLAGAVTAVLISRSITVPIGQAVELASRVAQGDLRPVPTSSRGDEIGLLLDALAQMQQALQALVHGISDSAAGIVDASSDVAAGHGSLAGRTEQAVSGLHRTVASLAQLTEFARTSAESAEGVNRLASSAREYALEGRAVFKRVVENMAGVAGASRRIDDIIGVIDEIANQTNMLALNAAVEAARAGEHGRGFAVVAAEVRNLAKRSADSAQEIKTLIDSSSSQVNQGASFVQQAEAVIDRIAAAVEHVAQRIDEVNRVTSDQLRAIHHVNETVGQLDRLTQQNADMVSQGASATASLLDEANKLKSMIGRFELG